MNVPTCLRLAQPVSVISRSINCWTAGITRIHRKVYVKTYPTTVVLPDGSSVTMQYPEPREIIVLPADPTNYFHTKYTQKPKVTTKITYKETTIKSNFNRKKYF